jgi:teichuronic acid biosynthesis glycosyltransferase TuaH
MDYTFLYPPILDFDWMKQRPQQLMKQLARRGHTVFFCNRTQAALPVEQLEDRLFLVHDHDRFIQQEWAQYRDQGSQQSIVWCTLPRLASSLAIYEANYIIYDCVDEFLEWSPDEPKMVAVADALVCTSERLEQKLRRQYPAKPVKLIRNAYDMDMRLHEGFGAKQARPVDLPDGKLVGYIGAWAPWVNEAILHRLARSLEGKASVVVIGPEFGRKYSRGRVHFLGMKPHGELARYLAHLSVSLIPFRMSPVTLATNPVKAYEYLAAGIPVVASDLPECRRMQPYVDTASTQTGFIELVQRRLEEPGDTAPRIRFALSNTWEHRCRQIEQYITSLSAG